MEAKVPFKCCSKCNIKKTINDFPANKTSKDGFRKECKKCHSKRVQISALNSVAHYEYINSDEYKEKQKEWQKKHRLKKGNYLLNEETKLRKKKERDLVSKSYCKQQLKNKGFKNITNELIEVQKLIIKTKRLCKTLQN